MSDRQDFGRTGTQEQTGARVAPEQNYQTDLARAPGLRPVGAVDHATPAAFGTDRVRWGPIWAGLIAAIGVYLLLELTLLATGAREIDFGQTGVNEGALLSGLAALVALFIGGMTAGASAVWRSAGDGFLHGVLVWGLTLVAFFFLSLLVTGLALGGIGTFLGDVGINPANIQNFNPDIATEDVRDAAGQTLLVLVLGLAAAIAGAILGSKLWPRADDASLDLRGQ